MSTCHMSAATLLNTRLPVNKMLIKFLHQVQKRRAASQGLFIVKCKATVSFPSYVMFIGNVQGQVSLKPTQLFI